MMKYAMHCSILFFGKYSKTYELIKKKQKKDTRIKVVLATRTWNNNQQKLNENMSRFVERNKFDLGHIRPRSKMIFSLYKTCVSRSKNGDQTEEKKNCMKGYWKAFCVVRKREWVSYINKISEAAVRRYFSKQVFLKISQYLQESCAGVCF